MRPSRRVFLLASAVCCLAVRATGQEKGRLGADVAFSSATSSTIGLTWHATNRVALRPVFGFLHETRDDVQTYLADGVAFDGTSRTTNTAISGGLEGMLYLTRAESLSTYVAVSYQRQHAKETAGAVSLAIPLSQAPPLVQQLVASDPFRPRNQTTASNLYGAAAGLEYAFGKRFSAFGEAGLRYVTTKLRVAEGLPRNGVAAGPADLDQIGTFTSTVGVIFYFK